jgi:AcrR family transcriptional regulator
VIRTKGLAAASTREIAREGGCADGTLYNHFRDRADMFVAIFLENLRAEQRLGRIAAQANPAITAEALFGTCANHALRKCFFGETPTPEEDHQFVLELVRSLMEGLSPREFSGD